MSHAHRMEKRVEMPPGGGAKKGIPPGHRKLGEAVNQASIVDDGTTKGSKKNSKQYFSPKVKNSAPRYVQRQTSKDPMDKC